MYSVYFYEILESRQDKTMLCVQMIDHPDLINRYVEPTKKDRSAQMCSFVRQNEKAGPVFVKWDSGGFRSL